MSEIANYTFLPWLRQGIANEISGQSGLRATVSVDLTISGEELDGDIAVRPAIPKNIEIYGPGDIVGIERSAIIKTEPRNWITNFEPNYLPYIEFYDEDFPWRYSPKQPNGHRLTPWLSLVVLEESEFTDGKNIKDRPLPYILLDASAKLPPSSQLWAWSHVHVNKNIIGTDFATSDANEIQAKFSNALRLDPDLAYSRILSPRKLDPSKAYHAFLVPVFETGLIAGRGGDLSEASAHDALAWSDDSIPAELPYYYRWYFRTGIVGDFEYLVRLLKPQPVDSRVGVRDMDVQAPGANIRGITDAPDAPEDQRLGGILKLGGALRIPDVFYSPEMFQIVEKYRNWSVVNNQTYPHPFQQDLAAFINLTDSYELRGAPQANSESNISEVHPATDPETEYDIAQNPDPLITAPLYGRWHALTQRLLKDADNNDVIPNDNWVHDLNLDPQWRVPAGFGTKIVQENQENYMKAAWEQVGDILESNRRIRGAQLARETSWVWHQKHIMPVKKSEPARWLILGAPLQSRVLSEGVTIAYDIRRSKVPQTVLKAPTRKALRPRGRLVKRLPFNNEIKPTNIVKRINTVEDVSAAPARPAPSMDSLETIVDKLKSTNLPDFVVKVLEKYPWIRWLPILLGLLVVLIALLLAPGFGIISGAVGITVAMVFVDRLLSRAKRQIDKANKLWPENRTPNAIDELPLSPDFRISTPAEGFRPTFGGGDSEEGLRFKQALRDVSLMQQESMRIGASPAKPALDVERVSDVLFDRLNPQITIPNWVYGGVVIPARIKDGLVDDFDEAMAYPEIDLPMYKPLADHSSELFLPNINYIAENSISLLETNQKFIESYMVGLNHEFARELTWREYPTDQRGSYFRQFWEAQGYMDDSGLSAEQLKEKLKDIPPIHTWLKTSDLGDHDHRELPGENAEEVVLVVRGELLKRYPNAILYAHRAVWRDDTEEGKPILDINSGQTIDLTKERDLRPLSEAEEKQPPRSIVKTPLYEAKVEPDIYFFGFDLTVCQAKGGTGKEDEPVDPRCAAEGIQWHDAGWFFVIKERSGEISMGLDVRDDKVGLEDIKVWNDVSWNHPKPEVPDGGFLQINDETEEILLKTLTLPQEEEKQDQRQEDEAIRWNKNMSSADLAYVLYQVPVLMAVHASEMLPKT